jgi:hypothetical protein
MPRKVGLAVPANVKLSLITCAYDAHIPREREFPFYLISINSFYRYRYTDTDIGILHSTLPIRVFQ